MNLDGAVLQIYAGFLNARVLGAIVRIARTIRLHLCMHFPTIKGVEPALHSSTHTILHVLAPVKAGKIPTTNIAARQNTATLIVLLCEN